MNWETTWNKWLKRDWKEFFRGLQWKLVVIFSLMIAISVQVIGVNFFGSLQKYFVDDLNGELIRQANLLKNHDGIQEILQEQIPPSDKETKLNTALKQLIILKTREKGTDFSAEVQILDYSRYVLASSKTDKNIGKINLRAQQDEMGTPFTRRDLSDEADYQVLLMPVYASDNESEPIGFIYIEASLQPIYDKIQDISRILVESTAIAMAVTGLLIILLTRTITTPVQEITSQATAMAEGDFDRRVSVKSEDEIGKLAKAFNHLASHLREALTEKEEEKNKLETVLASMTDGVIATDPNGNVIVKNRWAEKVLSREIHLGERIDQILDLPQPIQFPIFETSQQLLEIIGETPDDWTVIQATFSPITRGSEESVGLIAVLSDVTEQEKLDQQRKDFVANVSHELRTPLTTIKSYLEALDDGAMEEPELAKRFLKVTQQEADRMTRLIQDLLQLSRLDAKRVSLQRTIVSISDVLEDVVDRFSFQSKQKEISLSLQIQNLLPSVFADRDKVDQVLDNVISNAVKFTPEGGKITVTAKRRKDGHVEIGVEDTGIGIPKSDLGRIFERFYRVDKARSRDMGGTGLGLAIAQEIVQLHGGEIWIESQYQEGTQVYFTLPTAYRR